MKLGDKMNMLFKFSWHPLNDPDTFTTVFTHDKEHMNLFLKQHGFNLSTTQVEIINDEDEVSTDDIQYIKIFEFGSRKRDMIYRIATTLDILNDVTEAIADELCECMRFGACALRGEIEIFDRISKLIGELDYVYIIDEIDSEEDDLYRYQGYPYYESIAMDASTDRLYTDLYDDCSKGTKTVLTPFTIESYVSIFTNKLLIGQPETTSKTSKPRDPSIQPGWDEVLY